MNQEQRKHIKQRIDTISNFHISVLGSKKLENPTDKVIWRKVLANKVKKRKEPKFKYNLSLYDFFHVEEAFPEIYRNQKEIRKRIAKVLNYKNEILDDLILKENPTDYILIIEKFKNKKF